jgi:hypothetical protein
MFFHMWATGLWLHLGLSVEMNIKKEPPISHLESGSEWEKLNDRNQWRIFLLLTVRVTCQHKLLGSCPIQLGREEISGRLQLNFDIYQ